MKEDIAVMIHPVGEVMFLPLYKNE